MARLPYQLFLLCLLAAAPAAAQTPSLHKHGVAELLAVRQGPMLLLQLKGPAVGFVGFERVPDTEDERDVLRAGLHQLEEGRMLFHMPRAGRCNLLSSSVATPLLEALQPDARPTAKEDEDDHAGIFASYRFRCSAPAAVDAIDVRIFRYFTGTREIRAQVVTDAGGRLRSTLTPESSRLALDASEPD